MIRWSVLLPALVFLAQTLWLPVVRAAPAPYVVTIHGSIQGYRLAGVEPDGDPLYQVVLRITVPAGGGLPAYNLIVSSYLENFKPDTTPVLPDLLHPNRDAQNLGGFLQGKVLLTDDAGTVLSIGGFLAEAFLDNTNHAVLTLVQSSTDHTHARLAGTFVLQHIGGNVRVTGRFSGGVFLSPTAIHTLRAHQGATMRPLKDIIQVVTVVPHYYGTAGNKSSGPPLHTGFVKAPSAGGRHISVITMLAGAGAIVALLAAAVLYGIERRQRRKIASVQ